MSEIVIAILCLIVFLLSVIGNFLVISVIIRYKRLKNATNYILLSLAIADLTVTFCVMLPATIQDIFQEWIWSEFLCKSYIALDITCCTASILHLLLVAIDRYIAIFNPLTYQQMIRKWHIFSMVIFVWTLSFSMSFIPIFMGWNEHFESTPVEFSNSISNLTQALINQTIHSNTTIQLPKTCYMDVNVPYAIISSSLSFYIPLVIMTIVYSQIYVVAKRQAKQIAQLGFNSTVYTRDDQAEQYLQNVVSSTNDNKNMLINELLSNENCNRRNTDETKMSGLVKSLKKIDKKATKDKKAIKTLGIIMGIFTFCWLPFFVMYLAVPIAKWHVPILLERTITWIGYCNSFINPIVYALTNRDFRKAYVATLRSICENTHCIKWDDPTNKNNFNNKRHNGHNERRKLPYLFTVCCPKNETANKNELRKLNGASRVEANNINMDHKSHEKRADNHGEQPLENSVDIQVTKLIATKNPDSIAYIDEISQHGSILNLTNGTSSNQSHLPQWTSPEGRKSSKEKKNAKMSRKKSYLDFSDDESSLDKEHFNHDLKSGTSKFSNSGSESGSRITRKTIRRVLSQTYKKNTPSEFFSLSGLNEPECKIQIESKSEGAEAGMKPSEDPITVEKFLALTPSSEKLDKRLKLDHEPQQPQKRLKHSRMNFNKNGSDSEASSHGKKSKNSKKIMKSIQMKFSGNSKEKRPSSNMILDYNEWQTNEVTSECDDKFVTTENNSSLLVNNNVDNNSSTKKNSTKSSTKTTKEGMFIIRI